MQTHFDAVIGKINIIPQDIGRVLLNLYNNAFYAVSEKRKQLLAPRGLENDLGKSAGASQTLQGLNNYEPTVSVTTKNDHPEFFRTAGCRNTNKR